LIWARTEQRPARARVAPPIDLLLVAASALLLTATWLGGFGPVAPLMIMICAAALVALKPRECLAGAVQCWPLLIVIALAMLSALWSTAPSISLRYGSQLGITILAAVLMVSVLRPDGFVRAVFISSAVVLALCILSGRQGQSVGGPVLVGVLGSKNEMGGLTHLLICSGLALVLDGSQPRWLRLMVLPVSAAALFVLVTGFSAGAVLATMLFCGVFAILMLAARTPPAIRVLLILCLVAFAVPLWMLRAELAEMWEGFVVNVLHKDVGMTGRDYLWAYADRLIADRPVLGHGFRSTWLGSSAETIGLLRWAGLTSGTGFSFHDNYREWLVDFGYAGGGLIALVMLTGLARTVLRAMSPVSTPAWLFLASIGIVFAARAKVENLFGPFNSSTVIIVAAVAYGLIRLQQQTPRASWHG
jgi:exopolysaccharide production protein ExoQ